MAGACDGAEVVGAEVEGARDGAEEVGAEVAGARDGAEEVGAKVAGACDGAEVDKFVWNHARICSRPGPAITPVLGYGRQSPLQRQVVGPPLQVPYLAVQ